MILVMLVISDEFGCCSCFDNDLVVVFLPAEGALTLVFVN